jgi:hypothetical protein
MQEMHAEFDCIEEAETIARYIQSVKRIYLQEFSNTAL